MGWQAYEWQNGYRECQKIWQVKWHSEVITGLKDYCHMGKEFRLGVIFCLTGTILGKDHFLHVICCYVTASMAFWPTSVPVKSWRSPRATHFQGASGWCRRSLGEREYLFEEILERWLVQYGGKTRLTLLFVDLDSKKSGNSGLKKL